MLLAATELGLRVYAWEELLSAEGRTPPPRFAAEAEPGEFPTSAGDTVRIAQTYTLAFDAAGRRVLFAGLDGRIRFLELESGRAGVLLDIPQRPSLTHIGLSRDGSALACAADPNPFEQGRWKKPQEFQVWNYTEVVQASGL